MSRVDRAGRRARVLGAMALVLVLAAGGRPAAAAEPLGPDEVLRAIVRANADRDLAGMARHMARDPDVVNYSIAGSKFVGWAAVEKALAEEFQTVSRLEMPIHELKVWGRGDFAYFSMELDYIRFIGAGNQSGTLVPLRETGVLERRGGEWILVAWHESVRTASGLPQATVAAVPPSAAAATAATAATVDLGGTWRVQETDRTYEASLDPGGNGTYTWQGGQIRTIRLVGRTWEGTWSQSGNDREGGFELTLSDDGSAGLGHWWYTRVDTRKVPPREWGGPYVWKRIAPPAR